MEIDTRFPSSFPAISNWIRLKMHAAVHGGRFESFLFSFFFLFLPFLHFFWGKIYIDFSFRDLNKRDLDESNLFKIIGN